MAAGRDFTRLAADVRAWADGARAKPFSPPVPPLTDAGRARLTGAVARIAASANRHGLAGRLGDLLATAQEVDVMHMRPLGLAREWGVDPLAVTEMMLQAVRDGVLESRWSLLCPRCRGAKMSAVSLDRLPEAAHCPSCNVDYDREFSRNVELSFRPASAIRPVADLPDAPDACIVAVPAAMVPDTLEACAAKGAKAAVVFSSGFAEMGEEGRIAQDRIRAIARSGGMRVLGPNCLGVFNAHAGWVATFADDVLAVDIESDEREFPHADLLLSDSTQPGKR